MAEPFKTERRHLEVLEQAMATALEKPVDEALSEEIAHLLRLLERNEQKKAKPMTLAKLDEA